MSNKRYYWLRLQNDFFDSSEIQIIEDMDNGRDYILFYLKLLCKSLGKDGHLRLTDTIPYSEKMLAKITNTNIDIVRSAIKVFLKFGMIELLDDGTLYMRELEKMTGVSVQSDQTRESTRKRVRAYRERKKNKMLEDSKRYCNVTCNGETETETETDIETDIETDKDRESDLLAKIKSVCQSRDLSINPVQIYEQIKQNNTKVKNLEKYLISVDEYQKAEKKQSGSGTKFNENFHQREYDFDNLEAQLLKAERKEET